MELPISAKQFFCDFSSDIISFEVMRTGEWSDGLHNEDECGKYIAFLHGCNIRVGDVVASDNKRYVISNIQIETYNGKPEMLKAFY